MDIIILDRDIKKAVSMIGSISRNFKEYRVIFITDSAEEFNEYIKKNFFDVVIMDEIFIKECEAVFQYKVHKICLLETRKSTTRYISVMRDAEKPLYDNLAKILSNKSDSNEKIRELIRKELDYLGYNFSLRGTKYLEDAITLIYMKNCNYNLEREVFTQLSKAYMKSSHNIKVNIQNSTNMMIAVCGYNRVLEYLGIDSYYGVGTKAIICAIVKKIEDEMEENKK